MANSETGQEKKDPTNGSDVQVGGEDFKQSPAVFVSQKLQGSNSIYTKYLASLGGLVVVIIIVILLLTTTSSKPITDTWVGKGSNSNWSTAANWSNGVPGNNDSLVFNTVSSNKALNNTSYNDLGSLTLHSMKFIGRKLGTGQFRVQGQPLSISNGLVFDTSSPVTIGSLKLTSNQSLTTINNSSASVNMGLDLNGHAFNISNGVVTLSSLTGEGSLAINKGELDFASSDKSNPNFKGKISIGPSTQLFLTLSGNSSALGQGSVYINNGAQLLLRLNSDSTLSNPITIGDSINADNQPMIQASSNVLSTNSKSNYLKLTLAGNLIFKNNARVGTTSPGSGYVPVAFVLSHKVNGKLNFLPESTDVQIKEP